MQTRNRRNTETPEQKAQREQREREIRQQREREQHERKLAEIKRKRDWIEKRKQLCAQLRNPNRAITDRERFVLRDIAVSWMDIQAALAERAENLLYHPVSYFEWATTDMQHAAERSFLDEILNAIEERGHEVNLQTILEDMQKRLSENLLRGRYRMSSTSMSSNAMSYYTMEQATSFLGKLQGWKSILNEQ